MSGAGGVYWTGSSSPSLCTFPATTAFTAVAFRWTWLRITITFVKASLNSPDFSATRCRVGLHLRANLHESLHDNYCIPAHKYPVLVALSPMNVYDHEKIFQNPCLQCDERTRPQVICHTRTKRIVRPCMQLLFALAFFSACPHSTCFCTEDCKKRFACLRVARYRDAICTS